MALPLIPFLVAGAGQAVSGIANAISSGNSSRNQQAIANAQLEEARRVRELATQYAAATPQEINTIRTMTDQAYNTYSQQMQQIERDRAMLDSVDPSIKAAGEETLKLIRGEESRLLAPLQRQREQGREQLKSNLRQQLGPGYEISQAGRMALEQFDNQTYDLTAQAQQSTINSMLGLTVQAIASRPNLAGRIGEAGALQSNTLSNALQGMGNIQNRVTNAAGGMQATNAAYQNLIGSQQPTQSPFSAGVQAVASGAGSLGSILTNQSFQNQQLDMINRLTTPQQQRASGVPLSDVIGQPYGLGVDYSFGRS